MELDRLDTLRPFIISSARPNSSGLVRLLAGTSGGACEVPGGGSAGATGTTRERQAVTTTTIQSGTSVYFVVFGMYIDRCAVQAKFSIYLSIPMDSVDGHEEVGFFFPS